MATKSMFTNPYDAQIAQQDATRARALESSKIPWYQRGAYEGQMAGEDFGRNLGGMLGMQTAEEAKQGKIEEIMGQFGDGAKSYEQLLAIADSFRSANMLDLWEETMGMADEMKGTTTERSNLGKHYQDAMLIEGCEAGDVECEKRARKLMFRFKKPEDEVSKKMGGWAGKKLGESRDGAEKSIASIRTINRANRLIDKGITTGSFSGSRNSVARFFNTIGWTEDETVGATDEYLATLGYLVKDILGSGDFGAGTGLSDKDVEFVMRMIGSDTDIDEASLRRILNISERAHRETIKRHNDFSGQFDSEMLDRAGLKGFEFNLKMPDWSTGGKDGSGPAEVEYSEDDIAMFDEDGI
jgi:hypothetical protein